jgi:hypothetical protein
MQKLIRHCSVSRSGTCANSCPWPRGKARLFQPYWKDKHDIIRLVILEVESSVENRPI